MKSFKQFKQEFENLSRATGVYVGGPICDCLLKFQYNQLKELEKVLLQPWNGKPNS